MRGAALLCAAATRAAAGGAPDLCAGGSADACVQRCPSGLTAALSAARATCFATCGRLCRAAPEAAPEPPRRRSHHHDVDEGGGRMQSEHLSARRAGTARARAAESSPASMRAVGRRAIASIATKRAEGRGHGIGRVWPTLVESNRRFDSRGDAHLRALWAQNRSFTCSSARDCELLGTCVGGTCECDRGWTGPTCARLRLRPAAARRVGRVWPATAERGAYAWGFTVVRDAATRLYHAVVNTGCFNESGEDVDGTFLAHLVSSRPDAGFEFAGIIAPTISFNPHLVRAPSGEFVLYFRHKRRKRTYAICTGAPEPPPPSKLIPYLSQSAFSEGPANGIWVAWARSMYGPWQVAPVRIHGTGRATAVANHVSPGLFIALKKQRVVAMSAGGKGGMGVEKVVGHVHAGEEVEVVKVSRARWLGSSMARLVSPDGWVKLQELDTGLRLLMPKRRPMMGYRGNSTNYDGSTGHCTWLAKSNPSAVFVNGRVLLVYRYVINKSEGINIAWADDFRGPFLSTFPCNYTFTPNWGEDPFVWAKRDGSIHILYHSRRWRLVGWPSLHVFSENGTTWYQTKSVDSIGSYPFKVQLSNGSSYTYARRERPELLFDAEGRPRWFYSAIGHPPPDPMRKDRKGYQNSIVQQID